ncbi:hypothetical protein FXO38_11157 [Capsicum annuum]|nr:hypothetical protein FXO37_17452 [Capsicum annuum]KAF3662456.1 hypothetical protein FXO38_11157 [Capsicum annuum]
MGRPTCFASVPKVLQYLNAVAPISRLPWTCSPPARAGDYDCGKNRYGYEEDGDYWGYEYSHNQDIDKNKGYYSLGEYEMNDVPSSYSKYGDDKKPCDGYCKGYRACEGYYTSHSEPRGNVRYNPFISKSYDSHSESAHVEYGD